MFEEQPREERNPGLEVEEDIRISEGRYNNWKYIVDKNIIYKGKAHEPRWGFYMKEK